MKKMDWTRVSGPSFFMSGNVAFPRPETFH